MAVFTAISMWASSSLAFMGSGGLSFLGMSPALTAAVFRAGSAIGWSLASQALMRQNVPHQKVQATINQTDLPRVRAYGRVLLGGLRAFFEADDGKLYQIIVLHHGPVDSLIAFRVDGKRVTVDAVGMVTTSPINPDMQLYFRDGTGQGGDYATVRSAFPSLWTPDHRLQGQATMLAVMTNPGPEQFAEVWPKGPQTVLQAEVRGTPVRNMAGDLVYSDNAGLAIRDYLTHPELRLTVNPVTRKDLTLEAHVARGNVAADATGAVVWTAMSGDRFSAETGILENEQTYTVRYRWRGQKAWQKAGAVTIVANPNVPASPTQFARVGTTGAQFQWRNPAENFWKARLFRNTTNTFAGASFVDDISGLPGQISSYTDTPPAGTWYYFVVALNNSTVASPPAGPITI